jgi:hypothetical protein
VQQPPAIPPNAKCVACGYSLYQLESDRCPECGKIFDPNNPESMGIRRSFLETQAWRFEPPTAQLIVVLPIIAALLLVYASRLPGHRNTETMLAIVFWIAYIVGHGPWLLVRHLFSKYGLISANRADADRREIKRTIIASLISTLFFCVPIPSVLLFWPYRSNLKTLADTAPQYCADYPIDVWIGPMHFDWIGRYPNSIQLKVNSFDWSQQKDLRQPVFILNTDPRNGDSASQGWHLAGDWYLGS